MRRGGSFGTVILVVVTAVVLLLVARAWRELGGTALDAGQAPGAERPAARGATDAARTIGPGLDATRDATDAHAAAVGDALETID